MEEIGGVQMKNIDIFLSQLKTIERIIGEKCVNDEIEMESYSFDNKVVLIMIRKFLEFEKEQGSIASAEYNPEEVGKILELSDIVLKSSPVFQKYIKC